MGASKLPFYAYVDESGNTGKNIFDPAQPDFYTAAFITKGDFDLAWGETLNKIAKKAGSDVLHANELGIGKIESISSDLLGLLESTRGYFFLSRVEKKYLIAVKIFDVLFDSGENAAVAWHNYNFKPLKIILAFKLASIIDDNIAKEFWEGLLKTKKDDAKKMLPNVCNALLKKIDKIPDKRSQEIFEQGLNWVIKHPDTINLLTEQKGAKHGHFPNLVAFSNLLNGLQFLSREHKRKVKKIVHDEQQEFKNMLVTWHDMFSNAADVDIYWGGETYNLQMVPDSKFVMSNDKDSPGIQIADLILWLYIQFIKGKKLPIGCNQLVIYALSNGWHNDFSFDGVEKMMIEKWGNVFWGPISDEQLEKGREMLKYSETQRQISMKRYDEDGILPFMRDI